MRCLLLMSLILCFVNRVGAELPRLRVDGPKIVDVAGNEFWPRGINWSEPDLCNEGDMATMRSWGVNTVRVWCDEDSILRSCGKTEGRPKFNIPDVVQWASTNEVYLILVLGDLRDRAANQARPWVDTPLRERFRTALTTMTRAVADQPAVMAIEIQNEPPVGSTDVVAYRRFNADMTASIRRVSREIIVAVHGPFYIDDHDRRIIVPFSNVMYTRNFWDPFEFTHGRPIQDWPSEQHDAPWISDQIYKLKLFRDVNAVPVIVTEFGAIIHAPGDSEIQWTNAVIKALEEHQVPALYWGYRSYRGSSFHIYFNALDKVKPPRYLEWTSMLRILCGWWAKNSMTAPVDALSAPAYFDKL